MESTTKFKPSLLFPDGLSNRHAVLFHLQYTAVKGLRNGCLKMVLTSCCANEKWATRIKQAAASHSLRCKRAYNQIQEKLKSREVFPKDSVRTTQNTILGDMVRQAK